MPKSSSTKRTPSRATRLIVSETLAGSSSRTDSVISRQTLDGSMPVSASAAATVASRSRWVSWRIERLTEMPIGRASGLAACHSAACMQAASSTQRPIGSISEVVYVEQHDGHVSRPGA